MMTHGGVEIHVDVVVLKFSYIIRHGSDISKEYVNKKHLLTETSAHTNQSQPDAKELQNVKKKKKKKIRLHHLSNKQTQNKHVSVQTLLTDKRLPIH